MWIRDASPKMYLEVWVCVYRTIQSKKSASGVADPYKRIYSYTKRMLPTWPLGQFWENNSPTLSVVATRQRKFISLNSGTTLKNSFQLHFGEKVWNTYFNHITRSMICNVVHIQSPREVRTKWGDLMCGTRVVLAETLEKNHFSRKESSTAFFSKIVLVAWVIQTLLVFFW